MNRHRLSVSVDEDLAQAAAAAVARGDAPSVSEWVNEALRAKLEHERRLRGLAAFIEEYEAAHGEITAEEMEQARRNAQARAISVRQGRVMKPAAATSRGAAKARRSAPRPLSEVEAFRREKSTRPSPGQMAPRRKKTR